MKQKIGPAVIVVGVIVLAVVVFGIYKLTLGASNSSAPKASDAPDYVKQMKQHGGPPSSYGQQYGQHPMGQQGGPPSSYGQQYGQRQMGQGQ